MEKGRKVKVLMIVALIITVIGLSVAYSAMSELLEIKGSATVNSSNWDIHFETPSANSYGDSEYTLPLVDKTSLTDYKVILSTPGDKVEYIIPVVNSGSIDARIDEVVKGEKICTGTGPNREEDEAKVCSSISYNITYIDGSEIKVGDKLKKNEKKELKLVLEYDKNAEKITEDVQVTNLDIDINYVED